MEQTTKDKIKEKMLNWWATHPEYKRENASDSTKLKMSLSKLNKPRPPFTQKHKDNLRKSMLEKSRYNIYRGSIIYVDLFC